MTDLARMAALERRFNGPIPQHEWEAACRATPPTLEEQIRSAKEQIALAGRVIRGRQGDWDTQLAYARQRLRLNGKLDGRAYRNVAVSLQNTHGSNIRFQRDRRHHMRAELQKLRAQLAGRKVEEALCGDLGSTTEIEDGAFKQAAE